MRLLNYRGKENGEMKKKEWSSQEYMDIIDRLHALRKQSCTCGKKTITENFHEADCPYREEASTLWAGVITTNKEEQKGGTENEKAD
jgi:hypothetical protein